MYRLHSGSHFIMPISAFTRSILYFAVLLAVYTIFFFYELCSIHI